MTGAFRFTDNVQSNLSRCVHVYKYVICYNNYYLLLGWSHGYILGYIYIHYSDKRTKARIMEQRYRIKGYILGWRDKGRDKGIYIANKGTFWDKGTKVGIKGRMSL